MNSVESGQVEPPLKAADSDKLLLSVPPSDKATTHLKALAVVVPTVERFTGALWGSAILAAILVPVRDKRHRTQEATELLAVCLVLNL